MSKLVASALLLFISIICVTGQERARFATQQSSSSVDSKSPKAEFEYKLLATNRTTTMERELNLAANEGYRFVEVISGETFWGGNEALVVMARATNAKHTARYEYKLLATSKTSTMQKELQEAGNMGFEHCGQSVFRKGLGTEVIVILERDREAKPRLWDYKLLATRRTSKMQEEVMEAAAAGYQFVGFASGSTLFGGKEVVTIMRRPRE
jgi:hypothetical protein